MKNALDSVIKDDGVTLEWQTINMEDVYEIKFRHDVDQTEMILVFNDGKKVQKYIPHDQVKSLVLPLLPVSAAMQSAKGEYDFVCEQIYKRKSDEEED